MTNTLQCLLLTLPKPQFISCKPSLEVTHTQKKSEKDKVFR